MYKMWLSPECTLEIDEGAVAVRKLDAITREWVSASIGSGSGTPGPQGAQGLQGNPGTNGTNGNDGATGAKGDKGDKGDTGSAGSSGSQGIQGVPGDQGAPGVSTWGGLSGTLSNQTDLQTALNLKAPLASPTFTGTVSGVTKAHVGLGSADNTADTDKPVSSATQTALNLKATLASPTFTGTVTLPGVTISDAGDITIASGTGSKIGQSGSKIGFFGVTPVVRPSALTQTYNTTSATHAAVTQLAAPAGGTGVAAGGWSSAANRDLAITSINAARTDIANLKNFVNQIVDQLQALGLLQ